MRDVSRICILCSLVAVAVALAQTGEELPQNPHAFLEDAGECASCHIYWEGQLEPHMFFVMIHDVCQACHMKLGRSHPININPRNSELDIPSTGPLPLAYIDEMGDDVVSCGTCHNPHGEWLSKTKAYERQQQHFVETSGGKETFYYKTYYLRISDPVKGYEPLCTTCHYDF